MEKESIVDPYEIELLDLWDEVGGKLVIKYHTATICPAKEDLQMMRDKGSKTDVMSCVVFYVLAQCNMEYAMAFMRQAEGAGAAPSVTFEAADGEALNITGKEDNPLVNQLVKAVTNDDTKL